MIYVKPLLSMLIAMTAAPFFAVGSVREIKRFVRRIYE